MPAPLAKPAVVPVALPPPATLVTAPVASTTRRMRWLPWSARKTVAAAVPGAATHMRPGLLNFALVPTASRKPARVEPAPPATMLTVTNAAPRAAAVSSSAPEPSVTARSRLVLSVSRSSPAPDSATDDGAESATAAPKPVRPAPPPASVVTMP